MASLLPCWQSISNTLKRLPIRVSASRQLCYRLGHAGSPKRISSDAFHKSFQMKSKQRILFTIGPEMYSTQNTQYMLTSLEAEKHWRDLSTRHANRAVAAAHRKEALKKKESQTETDEEARSKEKDSSIEDSPRRSKRKHARSIKEGFYAETEGTVDDDVVSPRKVQKFHWLVGGGNEEEETCAGCSKNEWIVDEDLIEVDHMLALNNIYYFPRSRSKGVWKVLPNSIHDQAVMMCRKLNKKCT
ncbi:hypothetical protein BX666DRAFT_745853 [Dichotomocladium elegans]|nr:hypothetical protein BX666DRAFT_745853 [Dichotomocladium elegans]